MYISFFVFFFIGSKFFFKLFRPYSEENTTDANKRSSSVISEIDMRFSLKVCTNYVGKIFIFNHKTLTFLILKYSRITGSISWWLPTKLYSSLAKPQIYKHPGNTILVKKSLSVFLSQRKRFPSLFIPWKSGKFLARLSPLIRLSSLSLVDRNFTSPSISKARALHCYIYIHSRDEKKKTNLHDTRIRVVVLLLIWRKCACGDDILHCTHTRTLIYYVHAIINAPLVGPLRIIESAWTTTIVFNIIARLPGICDFESGVKMRGNFNYQTHSAII